jgi:hypothetical protein
LMLIARFGMQGASWVAHFIRESLGFWAATQHGCAINAFLYLAYHSSFSVFSGAIFLPRACGWLHGRRVVVLCAFVER